MQRKYSGPNRQVQSWSSQEKDKKYQTTGYAGDNTNRQFNRIEKISADNIRNDQEEGATEEGRKEEKGMAGTGDIAQNMGHYEPHKPDNARCRHTEPGKKRSYEEEELVRPRGIESQVMRLFTPERKKVKLFPEKAEYEGWQDEHRNVERDERHIKSEEVSHDPHQGSLHLVRIHDGKTEEDEGGEYQVSDDPEKNHVRRVKESPFRQRIDDQD